ncbi:MAG TPA: PQQ-dependent sugar dehydrogenase [Flavobacteriales bacterium]|nr:PQQ-dependent sugar dehydrogenase [Flavobacteriales bacterium]
MRTPILLVLFIAFAPAKAQTTPSSLRPDISVDHYMNVRSSAVRLEVDPISGRLYYLRTNGELLVVIDDGIAPPHDSVVFTTEDHLLDDTYGMTFHDSDLFVIGNQVTGSSTQGIVHRARLQPDGSRLWTVAAWTEPYAWGGKAHGFNNVVVSPDETELYLNCGSRTDHGEVQDVNGAYPELREEPITAKILRIPIDANELLLPNDEPELAASEFVFASGVRNTFDMAFDADGRLFGVENSGDHDDPEEMNWLRQGHHYGFPWTAGGNSNPTPIVGYDPALDPLLNPGFPSAATDFQYDPTFPPAPPFFTEPIRNTGPDADRVRDPLTSGIRDASDEGIEIRTFTCHRSPLGLLFDTDSLWGDDLRGDALMLSFTPGGDTLGFSPIAPWGIPVVPADPSSDLIHLVLTPDLPNDNFSVQATRIVEGFYLPVDAANANNVIYVLENSGGNERAIWKVTLPLYTGIDGTIGSHTTPLHVWPVPTADRIMWSTEGKRPNAITLLDMQGRVCRTVLTRTTNGVIAVNDLPAAVYLLRADYVDGFVHQRFVITK